MKIKYVFAVLFSFSINTINAQFTDNMESYLEGQPINESRWTDANCGGGIGCSIMSSSDVAHSGSLSGHIPGDGTTDAVLNLGNLIFAYWNLSFQMYVPSNKDAFFTMSGIVPVNSSNYVGDFHFNEGNLTPGQGILSNTFTPDVSFNFPHDQWFKVDLEFDFYINIGGPTWQVIIDDIVVVPEGTLFRDEQGNPAISLGGVRFTSNSSDSTFYLDDFNFCEDSCNLSISDSPSTTDFIAYPNPVTNILSISAKESISSIAIYNILGQQVYSEEINSISEEINMSEYKKGIYFIKATIGNIQRTLKIIK